MHEVNLIDALKHNDPFISLKVVVGLRGVSISGILITIINLRIEPIGETSFSRVGMDPSLGEIVDP